MSAIAPYVVMIALLEGLCAAGPSSSAQAMKFTFVPVSARDWCTRSCPVAIAASGLIELETAAQLEALLAAIDPNDGVLVFLNSTGGSVVGAMQLGQVFRRVKADVAIANQAFDAQGRVQIGPGRCLSACVYAFMGGERRMAPLDASIGIHRMYSDSSRSVFDHGGERLYDDGSLLGIVVQYAHRMGVSSDLVRAAEKYDSGTMHILTRDEIHRWNLLSGRH